MLDASDTIVAIATPPGRGGIGVVRLSGPAALEIARRLLTHRGDLEPRRATFTRIRLQGSQADPSVSGAAIDQVVATHFPAPHSYTGDDVVELSAHGSPLVLRAIVAAAIERGARMAEPGEFTLRAFVNGRIDLPQAEAVADLIDAVTPLQARAAFDQLEGTLTRAISEIDARLFDLIARLEASVDFPDEGFHFIEPSAIVSALDDLRERTSALVADSRRGRLIRDGLTVALVGKPNVGKSRLFNALVGASRAIVTEVPGTTRDLVTETVDLDGLQITLVDTAGLRETRDVVESEGVARSRQALEIADLVLLVTDEDTTQTIDNKSLIVRNKIDMPAFDGRYLREDTVYVSAATGAGLDDLRRAIGAAFDVDTQAVQRDRPAVTNIRHASLVRRAQGAIERARTAAARPGEPASEEFLLADLQEARAALEEITGRRLPEEVLDHIFSRFCIGK
jgi:tRNA modification GTPase